MNFIPNASITPAMLREIGVKKIDDLFQDIPKSVRLKNLNLSQSLSQLETDRYLREIASTNKSCCDLLSFLGGGIKPHYRPPVVKAICSRAEFYTAYTPYQPEVSQGFLQAMFEYQSMIAELTGMDIANCSLYDGVTALGEAVLMCTRLLQRNTFLLPQHISWEKKSVACNYSRGPGITIKEIPYETSTGKLDIKELERQIDDSVSGVYIENPNFFGIFEDQIDIIQQIVHDAGALLVVGIDPLSLGITRPPGDYQADVVIGEGRALGNPMDYGGSTLGIFACRKEYIRQTPGRIIGMTTDKAGKRAFCMALQTREQHIRRGKATSNICTNEGLCALAATTYLAWQGGRGLEEIGKANFEKGQELAHHITALDGFDLMFHAVHFNEFVIKCPDDPKQINKKLLTRGIHGGLPLEPWFPQLKNGMLLGVSEVYTKEDFQRLTTALQEVVHV
jgi:glycine dehydrogenase subunit 1